MMMANHFHLVVVVHEPQDTADFLCEVKRKLTEYIKRLHDVDYLTMWEDRAAVSILPTTQDVINRMAYLYANPAKANLVDTVDEYPGFSTWRDFLTAPLSYRRGTHQSMPWVQAKHIKPVKKNLSATADRDLCELIEKKSRISHTLAIHPYAWMEYYGEPETTVSTMKARIIEQTRALEESYRVLRREEDKGIMGAQRLRQESPTITGWKPKKRSPRLYIICCDSEVRMSYLKSHELFLKAMQRCFDIYKTNGRICNWPEGSFMPPLRPRLDRHVAATATL
jgi:hypothetical protein